MTWSERDEAVGVIEGEEKMTNIDLSWMFSCLVAAVPKHLAASHSLPLSPRAHRSPMSFLQGHKYFQQTPYCSHIIPPNAT